LVSLLVGFTFHFHASGADSAARRQPTSVQIPAQVLSVVAMRTLGHGDAFCVRSFGRASDRIFGAYIFRLSELHIFSPNQNP
jgi:hypothetical protein